MSEVAVKELRHGQRFRCYGGHVWQFVRRDSKGWIVWAQRECDGKEDCFAESATVTVLAGNEGSTQ